MSDTHRSRPAMSRRALAVGVGLLVATLLTAAACVPPAPSPPTVGAEISVSPEPAAVAAGTTVTVDGTGFTATGNLGTRPPFFNQPAGVYVVFGRFGDPWRPSEGAPASSRQVIDQVWALPAAQYAALGGASNPDLALMAPDGSFTVELELDEATGTGDYGIVTYAGSGAVNSGEELLVPVTFAP